MIFRFLLLTYAITWGALLPFLLQVGPGDTFGFPLVGLLIPLSLVAPAVAGLACAADAGGLRGLRAVAGRRPRAGDAGWLLPVLLGPAAVASLVTLVLIRGGTPAGPVSSPDAVEVAGALLVQIFFALGEEPGWRGFALPRLQRALPPIAAAILLGTARAAWLLPELRFRTAVGVGEPIATFLLTGIALSVVLTWLYNRTDGSIVLCVLFSAAVHAAGTLFERSVPLLWTNGVPAVTRAVVWGIVALLLVVATRGRLGVRGKKAEK